MELKMKLFFTNFCYFHRNILLKNVQEPPECSKYSHRNGDHIGTACTALNKPAY